MSKTKNAEFTTNFKEVLSDTVYISDSRAACHSASLSLSGRTNDQNER